MIYDHMNSKALFEWLRKVVGVTKPKAAPMRRYNEGDETWDDWRRRVKAEQPFGYWLTETLPGAIDDIRRLYVEPLQNIDSYMSNRFGSQIQYLRTGLKPGAYYDADHRILCGLFTTLVEFVESEKAWRYVIWDEELQEKYPIPWYCRTKPFKWFTDWHCAEAGLDCLRWEMSLTLDENYLGPDAKNEPGYGQPTGQAVSAKEQYDLYMWWTKTRPARPEPYSVMNGFYNRMHEKYPDSAEDLFPEYDEQDETERRNLHKLIDELEAQYTTEDEEMMIRLIKARKHLWT
jgi:hypothetical protein